MVVAPAEIKKRVEITYRSAPLWAVGEDGALRNLNAPNRAGAIGDDHYPEDYEGRITSVLESSDRPGPKRTKGFWRSIVKKLSEADVKLARSKRLKVSGSALVPVTDEDTYGAILPEMRRRFSQRQLDDVRDQTPTEFVNQQSGRAILSTDEPERVAKELMRALPCGEIHTASALYAVDASGATTSDTVAAYDDNILLDSEDFRIVANWGTVNLDVYADSLAGPLSDHSADRVIPDSTDGEHYIRQSINVTNTVQYTFSVYAKANGYDELKLLLPWQAFGANAYAFFDLDAGTVGTTGAGLDDAAIADAGGGWYRCSITGTAVDTVATWATINVCEAGEDDSFVGDGTSGLYLWGGQLETAASASTYKPTRGATDTSITLQTGGLTDGDHDGEFLNFTIADHDYQIIRNGVDSVLVTADATGEGGAATALTFAPHVTIQGGIDQLYADQGGTTFTFEVIIAVRTGTYVENVDVTTALVPSTFYGLRFTAPDGDLSVVINGNGSNFTMDMNGNAGGADGIEFRNTVYNIEYPAGTFRNCKFVGHWAYHQYSPNTAFYDCTFESNGGAGLGGFINFAFLYQCTIDWSAETASMTYFFGSRGWTVEMEGCTFLGGQHATGKGTLWHTGSSTARLANCSFEGLQRLWSSTQPPPAHFKGVNCVFDTFSETIFPINVNLDRTSGWIFEGNSYYNLTDGIILDAAGQAVTTLAGMQAAGYDTLAKSIDTDPLLNADGTLGAGSPCINAGIGSGVLTDAAGVSAPNIHHPAIGSDFSLDQAYITAPSMGVEVLSGTSVRVTFSGSFTTGVTNELRYTTKADGSPWIDGGSRTSNGTLDLAGLVAGTRYYLIGWSELDGMASPPTEITEITVGIGADSDPEQAIKKLLTDDVDVAAVVSKRVYPGQAPQKASTTPLPYVVFQRIDGDPKHHMGAASGLAMARIQVESYAVSYEAAKDLAKKIKLALDGYRGDVTDADGNILEDAKIRMLTDQDGTPAPMSGKKIGVYRLLQDFGVSYKEAVPTF